MVEIRKYDTDIPTCPPGIFPNECLLRKNLAQCTYKKDIPDTENVINLPRGAMNENGIGIDLHQMQWELCHKCMEEYKTNVK